MGGVNCAGKGGGRGPTRGFVVLFEVGEGPE